MLVYIRLHKYVSTKLKSVNKFTKKNQLKDCHNIFRVHNIKY